MSSLKPKEGGSYVAPPPPRQSSWIPIALIVAIIAIAAVAFGEYSTKSSLESRIAALEAAASAGQGCARSGCEETSRQCGFPGVGHHCSHQESWSHHRRVEPVPSDCRKAAPGAGSSGCGKRATRKGTGNEGQRYGSCCRA